MKLEDCHIRKVDGFVFSVIRQPSGMVQIAVIERNIEGGFWREPLPLQVKDEKRYFKGSGGQTLVPICEISEVSAQILFNRLWAEGFRPLVKKIPIVGEENANSTNDTKVKT